MKQTDGESVGFDLAGKRVIVTGGAGFLGRVVVAKLLERGVRREEIVAPRRAAYDLTTQEGAARLFAEAFGGEKVDVVLHLAAEVGGIGANRASPGRFFYANMAMAMHLIEQARLDGLAERGGKFVQVGSICSYPKLTPVPFEEGNLWAGYPEETNAAYGIAKKAAGVMLGAYHAQYGMRSAYVMPVNLYGPGDHFDLEAGHVVPALIRKCVEAKRRGEERIVCWGTGLASREFLYVDDCAEAVVRAAEVMEDPTPINVGAGYEITIRELVELIARTTGFAGRIEWDTSKPDGQPRRSVSTERAERLLGWRARVGLEEGLRRTVAWFEGVEAGGRG